MKGEKRDGASQMPKTAKIGYQPCSKANDEVYTESEIRSARENDTSLASELAKVLNRHNIDVDCNTPDFILAEYLIDSLTIFRRAQDVNVNWHGAQNHMRMQ